MPTAKPRSQPLAARLAHIPPTVFSEMSALALRTGAINLGQGFPDVDGPRSVVEAAERALEGGANQYAPGIGVPSLRAAIARHQQRHYGLEVDPDREVVVTTGCTEAVAAALLGLVDPGDEVVVLEPYYDSYVAMLDMCGAVRRPVTLRSPDFRPDLDELREAVTDRTKVILLNTPHNPTGTVLTRDELQVVADLAIAHDVLVITDEVYEHLVFDGLSHVPIATLPGMWERTLTLSSAGKSWSFTGWKVGWATGPAPLVGAVLAAKQWLTFTSGSPCSLPSRTRSTTSLTGRASSRATCSRAATCCARTRRSRPRPTRARGHLLHDHRHLAPRLGRRTRVLPRTARARRRGRDPHTGVPRRRRRRSAAGALGLLQAARRHRRGRTPPRSGRPRALTPRGPQRPG